MALTTAEKTELATLLTRDANNVNEDGLIVQVEKKAVGDKTAQACARARILLAKI